MEAVVSCIDVPCKKVQYETEKTVKHLKKANILSDVWFEVFTALLTIIVFRDMISCWLVIFTIFFGVAFALSSG